MDYVDLRLTSNEAQVLLEHLEQGYPDDDGILDRVRDLGHKGDHNDGMEV